MNPLVLQLFQTNRSISQQLNEVLKPFELFHSQWTILYLLQRQGAMTLTDIWQQLHVEAPTVTRTVNRLEVLGWVERRQGADQRAKIIALTAWADEKLPAVAAAVKQYEMRISQHLCADEQQQLLHLLQKMKG
ncbi:MarR family winged helix-turn-helix transcriptional regulator [Kurthia huakuii]|uniref:MarR family winged helix-turn-helix transcriptional regulator n=1 Tax=Kurthia huakuii TaxID=1421019 RepID=UPI000497F2A6|nr:MarR family transcriptional regulator [Kurthia huakuii]MBM7699797.1 DNA-binding MarR family transcriptional regulator [Kurthia huakuii]